MAIAVAPLTFCIGESPVHGHQLGVRSQWLSVLERKGQAPDDLACACYYGDEDWKRSVQSSRRDNFPAGIDNGR